MKTLVVSFYYTPEVGAAPSRITNLARGLKDNGIDVDVLTCMPNYPKGRIFEGYRHRFSMKENIDGIGVYRYWTYACNSKNPVKRVIAMLSFAFTMWFFAFRFRLIKSYDRVIIQSPPLLVASSAMFLFKKMKRKNVILNVSDLWPVSAVELGVMKEGGRSHRFMLRHERFIYRNADAVMGQSQEIINHVLEMFPEKKTFLYRNLQESENMAQQDSNGRRKNGLKIVYAGLFGVAQDLLSLVKNIDFKQLGVEFHLYGGGNQLDEILKHIGDGEKNVFYHGFLQKNELAAELKKYDVSIIPLMTSIKGAVPSKIFDILPHGIPVLFSGDGEGADIVNEYGIGLTSKPADYKTLELNIRKFAEMPDNEYNKYIKNCISASSDAFSFKKQMIHFANFIKE